MNRNLSNRAVWQISGGPATRTYAHTFVTYGVALIGPGDAGQWRRGRTDDEFEGSFVRRFATEVQIGDIRHYQGWCTLRIQAID